MDNKIVLKEGNSFLEYYQNIDKSIRFSKSEFDSLWDLHPENYGKIKL